MLDGDAAHRPGDLANDRTRGRLTVPLPQPALRGLLEDLERHHLLQIGESGDIETGMMQGREVAANVTAHGLYALGTKGPCHACEQVLALEMADIGLDLREQGGVDYTSERLN